MLLIIQCKEGKENKMASVHALQTAVKRKDFGLFSLLLEQEGVDVNQADKDGFTPLIYAAARGEKEMVEALINKGADLDKANLNGDGPLMWAILYNYQTIATMLVKAGADLNRQNIQGETPLMAAAFKGDGALAYLMIEKGANPSLLDKKKETAADKAFKRGYRFIAERLNQEILNQKQKECQKKNFLKATICLGRAKDGR